MERPLLRVVTELRISSRLILTLTKAISLFKHIRQRSLSSVKLSPPRELSVLKPLVRLATLLLIIMAKCHIGRVRATVLSRLEPTLRLARLTPTASIRSHLLATVMTWRALPLPSVSAVQLTGALSSKPMTQLRRVFALTSYVTPSLEMRSVLRLPFFYFICSLFLVRWIILVFHSLQLCRSSSLDLPEKLCWCLRTNPPLTSSWSPPELVLLPTGRSVLSFSCVFIFAPLAVKIIYY